MSTGELIGWGALALAGVGGSALCSATEIGLYTVNRVRLRIRARVGSVPSREASRARALEAELAKPERPLITLLIANTFFNNLGALGITGLLTGAGFTDWGVILLNALLLTPLLLVFAEILPKEISRAEADRLMPVLMGPLRVVRTAMQWTGIIALIELFARATGRLLGFRPEIAGTSRRDAMAALLKEGAGHGILSDSQTTLMDRALALRATKVGSIMQAWASARAVGVDWSPSRVARFMARHPHTRFPVIDARGRVVGVVELLRVCLEPGRPVRGLMEPPVWIRRIDSVRDALRALDSADAALAIVRAGPREPERAIGLITRRDLCEPLTDLTDPNDQAAEEPAGPLG